MAYTARILADSLAPCGKRLTTWELCYPRMVHAELMTHRAFSRNSASSRAIPAAKLRERVVTDPAMPVYWGANQKGMQATSEIEDVEAAKQWWLDGMRMMAAHHELGEKMGIHKQIVNRIIEPWMFITVIVSATDYYNWFHLRDHHQAQPEIAEIAGKMWPLYQDSMPELLGEGEWHLPLVTFDDEVQLRGEFDPEEATRRLKKISVGRCARVSYLTHDGRRDLSEDIRLHDQLASTADSEDPGHFSPFEHVASALNEPTPSGNFQGWFQYRKEFKNENRTTPPKGR